MEYQKALNEKINNRKLQLEAEERKKCQFRPQTCRVSDQIAQKKHAAAPATTNRFNELFEKSKKPKEKVQQVEYSFKPALTTFNPKMYQNNYTSNFNTIASNNKNDPADVSSKPKEKPTFMPKINHNGRGNMERKGGKKWVGDYLYDVNQTVKAKVAKKQKEESDKFKAEANKKFTQTKSETLLEKKKAEKITEIFKLLDTDSDGTIDSATISIESMAELYLYIMR